MIPPTPRQDLVETIHGTSVADPYRWLEDGSDPEVRAWVDAQRALARDHLDGLGHRDRWRSTIDRLASLPIVVAAVARGGILVTLERPAGAEQSRLTVRRADAGSASASDARVLVDPVADGDTTSAIDWFHPSPDGALVAYGTSEGGTERSVLRVVRTVDGDHLDVEIPETRACSLAWEPDASGFVYTRYPAGDEYHRTVHRHVLGSDPAVDEVVWEAAPTPQTWASVDLSPDGRHLVVTAMVSWSHDDVHVLDRATSTWRTIVSGIEARHHVAFAPSGRLLATTTLDAPNGRLVEIPLDEVDAGPARWRMIVAERDVVLGSPVPVGDRVLVTATRRAVDTLEVHRLDHDDGGASAQGTVGGLGVVTVDALTADPTTGRVFTVTSGFTAPAAIAEVGRITSRPALVRFDGEIPDIPALVVDERDAVSTDGATVGMFVIRGAHDADAAGPRPTILTGYGGFAISSTPSFSPLIAAWCAAGGTYVVAGLRGGLEHGEAWHRAGMRAAKQQVFDDFAAVADRLVDDGVTTSGQLAIAGGSNGGLLVGAAMTQRPDAYAAVWCAVPLLDMIRFPRFLIARLWTDEYGDPDVAEEFAWLRAYSPYHRVRPDTCYPATLLTCAEGDTRVDPLHARKMAAALQGASSCLDRAPVLLLQEGRAGHGVGKPRAMRVDEYVDVATFFSDRLGGPVPGT